MANKDITTKEYMSDNKRFANAFNYYFFDGEEVISSSEDILKEADTTELYIQLDLNEDAEFVQKFRDVFKSAVVKYDDKNYYVLLGIENQTDIHYAMPARVAIYNALSIAKQLRETAKKHRDEKDGKHTKAEYTSGWCKDDVLKPVITLVMYFGVKRWDAPRSLYDMMGIDKTNPLSRFVDEGKMFLIEPSIMSEMDFDKFKTDLSIVMEFLNVAGNKRTPELRDWMTHNPKFTDVDAETAMLISVLTDYKITIESGKETDDMCNVLQEHFDYMKEEGRAEGIQIGKEEGIQIGKEEGIQIGEEMVERKHINNMLKKGFSLDMIADITGLSEDKIKELIGKSDVE